jgi:hypothetical protein
MVHGIRLEAGQARWYRNRYVRIARETNKWARMVASRLTTAEE